MLTYRHTIEQFESDAHLGNDEVQLLYMLIRAQEPLSMQGAMTGIAASSNGVKLLLHSLDTKLTPLGYRVRSVMEMGYIVQDTTVKPIHIAQS